MTLGPCPHCGNLSGVYQAVTTTGRSRLLWDRDGRDFGICDLDVKHTPHSDAVRCMHCHHIRRDWLVWDGQLVYQGE